MTTALERMRSARRPSATTTTTTQPPVTFLTSSITDWTTDATAASSKSWADVALDDAPTVAPLITPSSSTTAATTVRETASERLARLRKSTATSSLASTRSSAVRSASSAAASSFAARLDAARATGGADVLVQFASTVSSSATTTAAHGMFEDRASQERRVQNQLDRAERKRRRDAARARDAAEKEKRAAINVARQERRVVREKTKLGNAVRRVEAQQAAKRKRDALHAEGKRTPGEELATLQRCKLFIHLEDWSVKDEPEALRRSRIIALRHVFAQFGAIAKLQFDFAHKHAFVTFAEDTAAQAAFDELSTLPRRELAARNAALALNLEPAPLTGAHFELHRAAYLKRSKAHKKARTVALRAAWDQEQQQKQ